MPVEKVAEAAAALIGGLNEVVRGQDAAVRQLVVTLVSGGHALLEGPPGIGKTLMVRAIAGLIRADFRRIQFTPDLMPADVTGTSVFRPQTGEFEFVPGPLFTQVLLGDEINRTPPKTQAALLEAMQERQVTLDGRSHPLPDPFFVVATQNPVEFEGTYPLPEAQLDRFFMKIGLDYPDQAREREIIDVHADRLELLPPAAVEIRPVVAAEEVMELRRETAGVYVEDSVRGYILELIRASREHRRVSLGGSSRAAVVLLFAAKASAACDGRDFVRPDDVKRLAAPVLRHRLILSPEAEVEGFSVEQVVEDLIGTVPIAGEGDGG